MQKDRKIRVLLAKPGLDTHERGVKLIAASLRDSSMEVIYSGVLQTTESILRSAIQEDADIIGLSFLCGGYLEFAREILEELRARGLDDVPVICGGIIPSGDAEMLKALGVKQVYGPGTPFDVIIADVRRLVGPGARKPALGSGATVGRA
jgi:methylmalonyl-CoA mutase C-terminal domain/subunit